MAKHKSNGSSEPLRQVLQIPIDQVLEPQLPAREGMDTGKLDELKESMAMLGLLSPILVVDRGGVYEVVAGHRRLLSARALGWKEISALVFDDSDSAAEAAKLHENVVREDLNPGEEAIFIAQLIDKHHLDEAGICKLLHKGPNYIGDRLRLLRGDEQVLLALRQGQITFAAARELNKFDDETMRRYYLDAAIRSGCASRVITDWLNQWRMNRTTVNQVQDQQTEQPAPQPIEPYRMHCEFCGGDKDPYNLVNINVHRWELDEIKRVLARPIEPAELQGQGGKGGQ